MSLRNNNNNNNENEKFSLRDKDDKKIGLLKVNSEEKEITVRTNMFFVDSRDCIGEISLQDSQNFSEGRGQRPSVTGRILEIQDTTPITVIIDKNVNEYRLRNNDRIFISGVYLNDFANKEYSIIDVVGSSFKLYGTYRSGSYSGTSISQWKRLHDNSYPEETRYVNKIVSSKMLVQFTNKLRLIRSISLFSAIIPRDFIPLNSYLKDFIPVSIQQLPVTYIPQEKFYLESQILGVFSSPLELFRTYINGAYSLPSSDTPFPLVLWNPPEGNWPLQPKSYPFQTVPTYRAFNNLILSGYGLYDFNDFSKEILISVPSLGLIDIGRTVTNIARKLLLLVIVQSQSINNIDYVDLIINSETTNSDTFPYGYGYYQRFIPGPGLSQNYQPATSDNADPRTSTVDWPIPFPNFNGNVYGPYDTPGAPFQKFGLLQTIQDLYLNGDLRNLYGDPIIKSNILAANLMDDSSFGINFNSLRTITTENVMYSTNKNITNSMKIVPNGFGTFIQIANGSGTFLSQRYQNGGGIGPNSLGSPPSGPSWTNNGLYETSNSGVGSYQDPIAAGPSYSSSVNLVPSLANASLSGSEISPTTPIINNRVSWYVGPSVFKESYSQWTSYLHREANETNLIITIKEGDKDLRYQGTSPNYNSMFSCPVRLTLGTDTGSIKYMEGLQIYLSGAYIWKKRFNSPLGSLNGLEIDFKTYEGMPIPIEKMLQERRADDYLRTFERIFGSDEIFDRNLYFLYDPLNPLLLGRTKRNISLIFQIETYEYTDPGLELISLKNLIENEEKSDSNSNDYIKASNYSDYS